MQQLEMQSTAALKAEDYAYSKLLSFAGLMWPDYEIPSHIKKLSAALEAVERGEIKRLMIFMPPRHGKSQLTSEFFPAWYLGRNPEKYIIAASYSQELADDFGRKVRNLVADSAYRCVFPTVEISDDSTSIRRFHTDSGGSYFAAGVGGPITGRGAHILLIDDPIKNKEEAESENYRRRIKDWYTSTAYTRLMPNGSIILIQTRWHPDDLAGWLLTEHTHENWHVVMMPSEKNRIALWPDKYPIEALDNIRQTIGERDFLALYQQTPVAESGNELKGEWIQYFNPISGVVAGECNFWILVDPANEKKKTSDYTAIVVIALAPDNNYYVMEIIRDKFNPTERIQKVMETHKKWLKISGKPAMVAYEKYGMMTDVHYLEQEQNKLGYRFSITEVGGTMKKEDRIRRLIPLFEQRRVYLPYNCMYTNLDGKTTDTVTEFVKNEYEPFPYAVHDDVLDALSRLFDADVSFPMLTSQYKINTRLEFEEQDDSDWMDI